MSAGRSLDVTVYGATGFVGKLLARYLAEHAPDGLRIGLAGRSQDKLERVRGELGGRAADWPLVVADSGDEASLREMAEGTRVVVTTVGPYRRDGLKLIDACIEAGTHYADLTGEVLFVRESIERHEQAADAGARIVHSCGFDSIPSDLGVLLLHQAAGELGHTTLAVTGVKGGVSGGTIASLKGQVDDIKTDREARRAVMDPYSLSTDRSAEPDGKDEGDLRGIEHDDDLGQWVGPFVMATYNTRIVRRSNALLDWAYGKGFRYREVMAVGSGPLGPVKGLALAGALGGMAGGLAIGPTRKVLDRVLPDPGEGPSEKMQRTGFFKMHLHTRTPSGARYRARVSAQGDPGYAATAMMLGESALCLALDGERLPGGGGILTPATAMGPALVDRLRAAGMQLEASAG